MVSRALDPMDGLRRGSPMKIWVPIMHVGSNVGQARSESNQKSVVEPNKTSGPIMTCSIRLANIFYPPSSNNSQLKVSSRAPKEERDVVTLAMEDQENEQMECKGTC